MSTVSDTVEADELRCDLRLLIAVWVSELGTCVRKSGKDAGELFGDRGEENGGDDAGGLVQLWV